ncbi:folate-binding protein YgfZ [Lysobacter sp. SG-8]|uniref:Folate-binding protein YgfZ n=1 Tax=Marilutibacter penaei TaxID=2759900 RepID=A0A7W3U563_9GAMM|nr:folate-binding protein YgfZ [Lysobacter penaei]MBB1089172.1 folate-binding protein YgfZ [Lysobacter penaei]
MSDNPHASPGTLLALPDHRLLRLSGPDAVAFAQAQFMNDVDRLAPGEWHWNGWLTPKGRVLALFAVVRLDEQTLWLLLPDADPHALATALGRFRFRSKLVLDVPESLAVSGAFESPARARGARWAKLDDGAVELDFSGDGGPRRLLVGAPEATTPGSREWRLADLCHGLPRLDASQTEAWTPQQLSLERLKAFSVKKGCYPGQEIVARTHFLGKAKRGLVGFDVPGAVRAGDPVLRDTRDTGKVACVACDGNGGHVALAVMPLEGGDDDACHVDGVEMQARPLLGGLER